MVHIHHVEHVMGTVFTINACFARSEESARAEVLDACRLLHQADDVFSTWRTDTPLSRLRAGQITTADVPQVVHEVLDRGVEARRLSGGWFDPWAAPGGVDPTGYVKGWAGQRVLDSLREAGAGAALVNAAGDVAGFGEPGLDGPWLIGIADPHSPHDLVGAVRLDGEALGVSGTYERGDHIFNPHAGAAASAGVISAAVLGPDLGMVDALATALVAGGGQALPHVSRLPGYSALVWFCDGRELVTGDFPLVAVDLGEVRSS